MRRIKIGIDVGGTFTHAVAVDAADLRLVGTAMVPTTHTAAEGVALGVVQSMRRLLGETGLHPGEVSLIAHSTTQATNALLEGDVAPVGVVGMGRGVEGWRARGQTRIQHLELAPGKFLTTFHRFLDTREGLKDDLVRRALEAMVREGAEVFVASEAFGVDHPENEERVAELAREMGFQATAAAGISRLYGLRVRTRTAVINASMMPRMLETAAMTERAVRETGIHAPLMIMRSDGGIMDVAEMRRRPILTMLSGPAAGVAAALMYARVSDGVFLEVGGTSTDISVIRNGRPTVRSAEVGGHRLHVRTLDVRTVGIGGGSLPRLRGNRVTDVGPRSAHIAGLRYLAYDQGAGGGLVAVKTFRPRPGDPDDYLGVCAGDAGAPGHAFGATEAANVLGLMRRYGAADNPSFPAAAAAVASALHQTPETLARTILTRATERVIGTVKSLVQEYRLDTSLLTLVGGGGGAEAIVPFAAERLGMNHTVTAHAEVISAIGVALGMIQDTIEKSIVNPTDADLLAVRREVLESVLRMGAAPESVEVHVEVDTRRKRVLATARGSPEMRTRTLGAAGPSAEEILSLAARSCGPETAELSRAAETAFLSVFRGRKRTARLLGLVRSVEHPVRVVDREGVVRLKLRDADVHPATVRTVTAELGPMVEDRTAYGDAGGLLPDVFVLVSGRIIDLSGLASREQIVALARAETETFPAEEPAVAILSRP